MASRNDKANVLSFLGVLLDRRDWVYLLSLLIPLFVYNLILKVYSIDSVPGLAPTFDLMRSDAFFNLGYALFWIGSSPRCVAVGLCAGLWYFSSTRRRCSW